MSEPEVASGVHSPTAQALLEAVIAVTTDLDLHRVLTRIVESACALTDAEYGALGVLGHDGDLADFITSGIDPHQRELIGDLPTGRGILRLVIDHPHPLRLKDLRDHPSSFGFPAHHPPMETFLGVPVRIRGTVFGNLYLTQKRGGLEFTTEDEQLVEGLASAAGFVIENARAYGLSERRRQWLEASAELTSSLQPPVDLGRAMESVVANARRISGALGCAAVRLTPSPAVMVHEGLPLPDIQAALEATQADDRSDGDPLLQVPVPSGTAVFLPLRTHLAESTALLAIFDRPRRPDEYDDLELLAAYADQAGLACDRAQAWEDRQELALVSDRDRIARDLHDIVIQRLFSTGMTLQALRTSLNAASLDEIGVRLDRAVDELDVTVKNIRSTIFALQQRGGQSFRADVSALVQEYVPVLGATPALRTAGPLDARVGPAMQEQVLAVLREALSNAARHARARQIDVEIGIDAGTLVVRVTDDGVGAPPDRTESGLRNARRRAAALGGTFELRPGEISGTEFVWQVPLG